MAVLLSESNITYSSASWKTVSTSGIITATTSSQTVGTTTVSTPTFTPGTETYEGILLYIRECTTTTGTFTAALVQGSTVQRSVTVNKSDLSGTTLSTQTGSWYYFKFGSSFTTAPATTYIVSVSASTSGVQVYNNGVSNTLTKAMVTSTTASLGAGDVLIVAGPMTTTSTPPYITTTYDYTGTTTIATLEVGGYGKLSLENSTGKSYKMYLTSTSAAGTSSFNIGHNGIAEFGTSSSRLDSSSTMTFYFQPSSYDRGGVFVKGNSSFRAYGASKTRNTRLAQNTPTNSTTLVTTTNTGWLNGDVIGVGSSQKVAGAASSPVFLVTMTGNSVTTSLPVTVTTQPVSGGTIPTPIINMTSNLKFSGVSSSATFFVKTDKGSNDLELDNCEFQYIGDTTTPYCVLIDNSLSGATANIINCTFRNPGSYGGNFAYIQGNTSAYTYVISGNNIYNGVDATTTLPLYTGVGSSTGGTYVCSGNYLIGGGSNGGRNFYIFNSNCNYIGNVINCHTYNGYDFGLFTTPITGIIDGNEATYCSLSGALPSTSVPFSASNFTLNYNGNYGLNLSTSNQVVIKGVNASGNTTSNVNLITTTDAWIYNGSFGNPFSVITNASNIQMAGTCGFVNFDNCSMVSTNLTTSNFQINGGSNSISKVTFRGCTYSGALSFFPSQSQMYNGLNVFVSVQKQNGTKDNNFTYYPYGIVYTDTVIYDTSGKSLKCVPSSANAPLRVKGFEVPLKSGYTLSVSLKVRKSVVGDGGTYNGIQPYVVMKYNPMANFSGITSDVIIGTATDSANGAWETLTYTTPISNDNTNLEFWFYQTGTTGWINWDSIIVK
jgi:hypothetical protein